MRQASAPPPIPPTVNPSSGRAYSPPPLPSTLGYPYCPPGVSLLLGFIPGVGSICNGDYLKAFLQVLVFGSLVSLSSSNETGDLGPAFGILTAAVYLYMPFDAYHVAKKRTLALQGITVITPLEKVKFPELWVGCLAILVGSIFLVNQFVPGTLRFVLRGWPSNLDWNRNLQSHSPFSEVVGSVSQEVQWKLRGEEPAPLAKADRFAACQPGASDFRTDGSSFAK